MHRMSSMYCKIAFKALIFFALIIILIYLSRICYVNDDSKKDHCNSPSHWGKEMRFIEFFCSFNNFNSSLLNIRQVASLKLYDLGASLRICPSFKVIIIL